MTVLRTLRLALFLVMAGSSVVIAAERRAQTEVREREECFAAGLSANRDAHDNGLRNLTRTLAAACDQRDPTPDVRLLPPDDDDGELFGPPEPQPVPRHIGVISAVSPTGVTIVERCDQFGNPLERTTVFRFADAPAISIPSAGAPSGAEPSTVEGLTAAAGAHQAWELTVEDGRVTTVFPWFLEVCR